MLIIGHRGIPSLAGENTLSSFHKAAELGVDMIELDLRLTKDDEIVVIHDHNLFRLFQTDAEVADLTLDQMRKITLGVVPTLDEVLTEIAKPLNLHIKVSGMEEQLLKKISKFPHRVLISSVNPRILKKIRTLDGNIQLGLIIGTPELHLMFVLNWLVKNLNLYSIHPRNILVSMASMPILNWHKRKVIVWDVNTKRNYDRLAKLGVYGVITDVPQKFI